MSAAAGDDLIVEGGGGGREWGVFPRPLNLEWLSWSWVERYRESARCCSKRWWSERTPVPSGRPSCPPRCARPPTTIGVIVALRLVVVRVGVILGKFVDVPVVRCLGSARCSAFPQFRPRCRSHSRSKGEGGSWSCRVSFQAKGQARGPSLATCKRACCSAGCLGDPPSSSPGG